MLTIRIRSAVWFVTGAMLATAVTLMFVQAWRVDAAPGDSDATLVPITPCRLEDTRQAGETPLGPGETRTIDAHGTNGPIPGSQCTIPADAVGLSMNVTALDATVAGTFWTIWPDGQPRPEASSLNPSPGQPPTPNAVTTPISSSGRFNVFNFSGTVNMLIDVNGYYTKTSLKDLANRLAAAEADIATHATGIATNASNVAALDAREPFAVTAVDADETLAAASEVVVAVNVRAPAAGKVTVNSTTGVFSATSGTEVFCSINKAGTGVSVDTEYKQWWQSSGSNDGDEAQLAGTRTFATAAGESATYQLVCRKSGAGASANSSVVTAIFTPAP